jgi:hypothetical protein
MRRTIPAVEGGRLYRSEGDAIIVGTPAWYDWLEHHSSFLFADLAGAFSAHKSGSESSAQDWEAIRTHTGKLSRLSLGSSRTLTLARLQMAAQALADRSAPAQPAEVSPEKPAAPQPPVPEDPPPSALPAPSCAQNAPHPAAAVT